MFPLDDPSSIPDHLLQALSSERAVFERHRYFDHLLESRTIRLIADELDQTVSQDRVIAFHCCKELSPSLIVSRGLRTLSIDKHVQEFLDIVEVRAPQLRGEFRRVYGKWKGSSDMKGREGRLSFCLARELVVDEGTERFFRYYGGEALYWPFDQQSSCLAFLESLGRPVVVEVHVAARDLSTFSQRPFARSLLSYYARSINPTFRPEPLEAQMTRSVLASEIARVHERDEFFRDVPSAF